MVLCVPWVEFYSTWLFALYSLGGSYRDQYSVLAFLAWASFHDNDHRMEAGSQLDAEEEDQCRDVEEGRAHHDGFELP